jgi:hypothetical protein
VATAPASAEGYGGGTLTIDDATLAPGQQFHLSGTGCAPASTVVVRLDGRQLGVTHADGDGDFVFVGTVPPGTAPGQHTLSAVCGDLDQSLVITVPGPAAHAGMVPRTGAESVPFARVAAVLLLCGAGALLLARRYRAVTPSG